ncbi:phage baseplate assembly protein V [Alteromonadaceae bacterium 2753L.S.0a.02]|nr:phage baseplate assembly protein V [Alteromonadaceae bacterium 2753L.S.0a.02]
MTNFAEVLRLLSNIVRFGLVSEIDHSTARVRVQTGENLTDWLPWLTLRAAQVNTWNPPEVGEQVLLLSPQGELNQGVALTGLYSDQVPAPRKNGDEIHTVYPDGTFSTYNHAQNKLTIEIKGAAELTVTGDVNALVNGNVTATVDGDTTAEIGGDLSATVNGKLTADAPQIALNGGAGVVTGNHICPYTGSPHPHVSSTVKAGI